jgi:hypothetical protein
VFDHWSMPASTLGSAKIVWAEGRRLSIERSAERIHAEHPGVPPYLIETHLLGRLSSLFQNPVQRQVASETSLSRGFCGSSRSGRLSMEAAVSSVDTTCCGSCCA